MFIEEVSHTGGTDNTLREYWLKEVFRWLSDPKQDDVPKDPSPSCFATSLCLLIHVLIHGSLPQDFIDSEINFSLPSPSTMAFENISSVDDEGICWDRLRTKHQILMESRSRRSTIWRRKLVLWVETYPEILLHALDVESTLATRMLGSEETLDFLDTLPLGRKSLCTLLPHAVNDRPDRLRKVIIMFGIDQIRKCMPYISDALVSPILSAIEKDMTSSPHLLKILLEKARHLTSRVRFRVVMDASHTAGTSTGKEASAPQSLRLDTNRSEIARFWQNKFICLAQLPDPLIVWESISRAIVLFPDPYTWLLCLEALSLARDVVTDSLRHASLMALSRAFQEAVYSEMALEASLCLGLSSLFKQVGEAESPHHSELVPMIEKGLSLRSTSYDPNVRVLAATVSESFFRWRLRDLKAGLEHTGADGDEPEVVLKSWWPSQLSEASISFPATCSLRFASWRLDEAQSCILTLLAAWAAGTIQVHEDLSLSAGDRNEEGVGPSPIPATVVPAAKGGRVEEPSQAAPVMGVIQESVDIKEDSENLDDLFFASTTTSRSTVTIDNVIVPVRDGVDEEMFASVQSAQKRVDAPLYDSPTLFQCVERLRGLFSAGEVNPEGASLGLAGKLDRPGQKLGLEACEKALVTHSVLSRDMPNFLISIFLDALCPFVTEQDPSVSKLKSAIGTLHHLAVKGLRAIIGLPLDYNEWQMCMPNISLWLLNLWLGSCVQDKLPNDSQSSLSIRQKAPAEVSARSHAPLLAVDLADALDLLRDHKLSARSKLMLAAGIQSLIVSLCCRQANGRCIPEAVVSFLLSRSEPLLLRICHIADQFLEDIEDPETQVGILAYLVQDLAILVGLCQNQLFALTELVVPLTTLLARLVSTSFDGSASLQLHQCGMTLATAIMHVISRNEAIARDIIPAPAKIRLRASLHSIAPACRDEVTGTFAHYNIQRFEHTLSHRVINMSDAP